MPTPGLREENPPVHCMKYGRTPEPLSEDNGRSTRSKDEEGIAGSHAQLIDLFEAGQWSISNGYVGTDPRFRVAVLGSQRESEPR